MISAVGHVAIVGTVLWVLASPRLFHTPPEEAIAVDLVEPEEVPANARSQANNPDRKPEEAQHPDVAQTTVKEQPRSKSPRSAPDQTKPLTSLPTFNVDEMLPLYNFKPPPETSFDAPADATAKLQQDDIAAFRLRLKKCWRQPPGVSASSHTRVVMRVFLGPDGALAAEPMLIEAAAAADGPAVMRAALDALTQCAPFSFLPADRYSEWKELDIAFSPHEMGGG
jgi:hypothetical protein